MTSHRQLTCLVTGASGFVGDRLVPALLQRGHSVRVLARSPDKLNDSWHQEVAVVAGDAADRAVLHEALAGADVAYFLLHSMDGEGDYAERDRRLATAFAEQAKAAGVQRIVYLSGLHPDGVALSEHLASRVEVGEILLASGVPTAVLQAGVVIGERSASFQMLRHLTERLPAAVGPRWLRNRIQPIAIDDVVHYLCEATTLPADVNRTIDIGMPEVLSYRQMMKRYARVAGLGRRLIGTVPVLTPGLASHWVGVVTPVKAGIAKPLVGSLIHDAVITSHDTAGLKPPPEGLVGFDEAVRRAIVEVDVQRWRRIARLVAVGVIGCAATGSILTTPDSRWYRSLRKPAWQPPPAAFPVVWTGLYALLGVSSAGAIADLAERGDRRRSGRYATALAINLALNAAWSGLFFRARALGPATAEAALLAISSADLARRAAPVGAGKVAALGAYSAWTTFATVLTGTIWQLNRTSGGERWKRFRSRSRSSS